MSHARKYTARPPRLQWRIAAGLTMVFFAGGCVGLSIPLGGLTDGAPTATGSLRSSSALPLPLPASLDPSDAGALGEAMRRAASADYPQNAGDWANPDTGSNGTLALLGTPEIEGGETCQTYASTVTSIKGVHRYTGRTCRAPDGRVTVRSIEAAPMQTTVAAGI